jgi:2',3'-cyclic-nucleotide 2'-phosphodiesterase (5'-nucleotidase family)
MRCPAAGAWSALLGLAWLAVVTPSSAGPVAKEARTLRLDVLFTSDIHGHIDRGSATFMNPEFPPPLGGGASIATYLDTVRSEAARAGRRVLLFDVGDNFQGTPLGTNTRGTAIVEWMNRMRYDAATLGNHDFDLGRENTERLCGLAAFPVVCANLFEKSTGQRVPWVRDHVMVEVEDLRIGILGYITESTVYMSFERNVAGLEFRPVADQIHDDVRRVREAGADLVFVLFHHGLPYRQNIDVEYQRMVEREARGELRHFGNDAMELARMTRDVDAIFGGHTHQGYDRPWQDPRTHTLVFEPYANGSSLGHVTLLVDRPTRALVGYETHFDRGSLLTTLEEEIWPDSTEAALIGSQVAAAEAGLEVEVGRAELVLEGGAPENGLLGFVVADAFREELHADAAVQNTGGIRRAISAGPITERDLLETMPFNNQMVLASVPGGMLRALVEDKLRGRGGGMFVSGMKVRYDLTRPEGARIVSLEVGGTPIDTTRTYKLALTDYLAEGNSGFGRLTELPEVSFYPAGATDREVLSRYIQRVKVLKPVNDGRWTKVGGP